MPRTSPAFDRTEALMVAQRAAQLGREVLLHYFGQLTKVKKKELAGLVTEADVESEKVISHYLLSHYPKFSILGEEDVVKGRKSASRWIIDPLDGTTNYVHRFPIFCISIGLELNGILEVGVVDVPKLDTTYYAFRGGGAFVNGRRIKVSNRKKIQDSLLATGFFAENKNLLEEQLRIFSRFISQARGVRRAGAAAYDLCLVAEGVFDVFWEKNLRPWDTAAGTLLIREAGGTVTNFKGHRYDPEMPDILASNSILHAKALKELNQRPVKNQR